ncbi:MAG: DUF3347 domain-containing protein [Flavobacterium sp.]|nr:DUF3347 domain-containing protein [Flavobacterium sp.]
MKITFLTIATMVFGLTSFAKSGSENLNAKPIIAKTENLIAFSTTEIIKEYLNIKNALVKSNSKRASQSATALELTFKTIDVTALSAAQKTVWIKIGVEARKQTKAIASNTGKLDRQRKAFQQLSTTINELVTAFGSTQKLYQDFCPMYEGGSMWLSENKDIKNPFYGAQMLTCGRIQETDE